MCLPGGFGTLDETFELLTLLQTGKASPRRSCSSTCPGGTYWTALGASSSTTSWSPLGCVSPEDHELYLVTDDVDEAVAEIERFWRNYHSIRWVGRPAGRAAAPRSPPTDELAAARPRPSPTCSSTATSRPPSRCRPRWPTATTSSCPALVMRYDPRQPAASAALIDAVNDLPPRAPRKPDAQSESSSSGSRRMPIGLLHRAAGPGEAPLVDRQLVAAGVDRLAQPLQREVGQLLGDGLEPAADVVELSGHARATSSGTLRRSPDHGAARARRPPRVGVLRGPRRRAHLGLRPHVPRQRLAVHLRRRAARACSPAPPRTSCRGAAATAPTSSTRRTRPPRSPTPRASPTSSGSSRTWRAARAAPRRRTRTGELKSRVVDGACIFLNRPGLRTAARAARCTCAALEAGERPLDWKPDVCWQLPLRLEEHTDDHGHVTSTLREWKRRDWGAGGDEFHWWCTEDPEAFVDHQPGLRDQPRRDRRDGRRGGLRRCWRTTWPPGHRAACSPTPRVPRRAVAARRSGLFGGGLSSSSSKAPYFRAERGVLVVLLDLRASGRRTRPGSLLNRKSGPDCLSFRASSKRR